VASFQSSSSTGAPRYSICVSASVLSTAVAAFLSTCMACPRFPHSAGSSCSPRPNISAGMCSACVAALWKVERMWRSAEAFPSSCCSQNCRSSTPCGRSKTSPYRMSMMSCICSSRIESEIECGNGGASKGGWK
jgi:hypothetical protein